MTQPIQDINKLSLSESVICSKANTNLVEKAKQLVEDFDLGILSVEDAIDQANQLIENLHNYAQEDCCASRKGLGHLLLFREENVRSNAFKKLECLLSSHTLAYDADNGQFQELINLEAQISSGIECHIRYEGSKNLIPAFFISYANLLEHLWLIPYFTNCQEDCNAILEQNKNIILTHKDNLLGLLSRDAQSDEKLKRSLEGIERASQRIFSSVSWFIFNEIQEMKKYIIIPFCLSMSLVELYLKLGDFRRAIYYCKVSKEILQITEYRPEMFYSMWLYTVYEKLGSAYHGLYEYEKAIQYYNEALTLAIQLEDCYRQRVVYVNLGLINNNLKKFQEAITNYQKALGFAQMLKNETIEKMVCKELAKTYKAWGNHRYALQYYKRALELSNRSPGSDLIEKRYYMYNIGAACHCIGSFHESLNYYRTVLEISNSIVPNEEGEAYSGMGNVYCSLGDFQKAIDCHTKHLNMATNDEGKGIAYSGLGAAYFHLGEHEKAIENYQKYLEIAKLSKDIVGQGNAYAGLGVVYDIQREYEKAIENHQKHLEIAKELNSLDHIGIAYGNLGSVYYHAKDYEQAINFHKEHLKIAIDLVNDLEIGRAIEHLGVAYYGLKQYEESIKLHEEALRLAKQFASQGEEAMAYTNMGLDYLFLYKQDQEDPTKDNTIKEYRFQLAEQNFRNGIKIYSELQSNLNINQWKITILEKQIRAYDGLEHLLSINGKDEEALVATDLRRACALNGAILRRCPNLPKEEITVDQIKELAKDQNTTFLIYSLVPFNYGDGKEIDVWIVSPQGNITKRTLPVDKSIFGLEELNTFFERFPYVRSVEEVPFREDVNELYHVGTEKELYNIDEEQKFIDNEQELYRSIDDKRRERVLNSFKQRLKDCYQALINPIVDYLPNDPKQVITIVPDGVLAHMPFAILQDSDENYFIEKHPISIIPSIKTLQLLAQHPRTTCNNSLMVGNPKTLNPEKDGLPDSVKEVEKVKEILGMTSSSLLIGENARVNDVIGKMKDADVIHLACHGIPDKKLDPNSVFEGLLNLSPDANHPEGYLYAQNIGDLSIHAKLVFISACYSGLGKIHEEGNIGHVWSFLAAGALSTVAAHWRVFDSPLTVSIIEEFYKNVLGKGENLNKAQALQQAMLMAMKKERDRPDHWGSFFLSGL